MDLLKLFGISKKAKTEQTAQDKDLDSVFAKEDIKRITQFYEFEGSTYRTANLGEYLINQVYSPATKTWQKSEKGLTIIQKGTPTQDPTK